MPQIIIKISETRYLIDMSALAPILLMIILAILALPLALALLVIALVLALSPIIVIALVVFLIIRASKKKKVAVNEGSEKKIETETLE